MKIPLIPDTCYHVYNHANGKGNLFSYNQNNQHFLHEYEFYE